MDKKKIINTNLCDGRVDVDITLNTGEYNGLSKISIDNQDNKYAFKMHTLSMVVGSDIIKSLDNIIYYVKSNIYKNTYYSYGDIIDYFLQALLQEEACNNDALYKALDTWYWGEDDEQEDD